MKRISLLLSLLTSSLALAYNYTEDFNSGFYWQTLPVNLTIIPSGAPTQDSAILEKTLGAASEWNAVTQVPIFNISSSGDSANLIRCSRNFESEPACKNMKDANGNVTCRNNTTLAITTRYTEYTYMARTEIILNDDYFRLCQKADSKSSDLYTIVLHELGHVVGLGHSEDESAIMYPQIGDLNELGQDDVEGMQSLVATTLGYQQTGYVSALANKQEETNALGCGTVALDQNSSGGMGGPLSFALTLLAGFGLIKVARKSVKVFAV